MGENATNVESSRWHHFMPAAMYRVFNNAMLYLSTLIWAVAGMCAFMAVSPAFAPKHAWAIIPVVLVLVWLAVLAHELGHACAARIVGARVFRIQAGPLDIWPWGKRVRVRLHKPMRRTLGHVEAFPDPASTWRRDMPIVYAGGPVASLAGAMGAGVCAWFLDGAWGDIALGFAFLNAAASASNALPTERHHATDGWMWLQWKYGWREADDEYCELQLVSHSVFAESPDEIPEVDTPCAVTKQLGSHDCLAHPHCCRPVPWTLERCGCVRR